MTMGVDLQGPELAARLYFRGFSSSKQPEKGSKLDRRPFVPSDSIQVVLLVNLEFI